MGQGPLAGLRVVDLTSVIMGPMATSMLGDFGAEVIKVEQPGGDINRTMGRSVAEDESELSLNLNRNKASVVLNLKDEAGCTDFLRLIATADVFVTNLRPRALRGLGACYEDLSAVNEKLVYCTAQGYASDSMYAEAPAYDDIVQAASGMAGLAMYVTGAPEFAPHVAGDKIAALYVAIGILSGLQQRNATGRGCRVDVPMVDTLMSFNLVENLAGLTVPDNPGDFGWARTLTPVRALYEASNGWVTILPYTDKNWSDFFEMLGRDDLAADERFQTLALRTRNMSTLIRLVAPQIQAEPTQYWIRQCQDRDIPAALVKDPAKVVNDEYAWDSGVLSICSHPRIGAYRRLSTPIRFDGSIPDNRLPAPALGQHTSQILGEIEHAGCANRTDSNAWKEAS